MRQLGYEPGSQRVGHASSNLACTHACTLPNEYKLQLIFQCFQKSGINSRLKVSRLTVLVLHSCSHRAALSRARSKICLKVIFFQPGFTAHSLVTKAVDMRCPGEELNAIFTEVVPY